ncbi:hypothetical protein LUZ60_013876 [Juncus effusus]|nr:hypothetical protein LUZ60_013876 [Juncus effusus]
MTSTTMTITTAESPAASADQNLLPLATLIGRELRGEKSDNPIVKYAHANYAKRGEDLILVKTNCLRVEGDASTSFSAFGVFDGHNGAQAAIYSKEYLLDHIMSAVPQGLNREQWLRTLPAALVAGFVKCDILFQTKGDVSGTTATLAVVDGLTVTVASVGDSRCILEAPGGELSWLTVDHRLEDCQDEVSRVQASGGEVGRLNVCGGHEVGPLRCWPGGLCLSRSIGDMDVGEFIVPVPYVKQVKLPSGGGRLIIASDGIWDAIDSEVAAKACHGLPTELAAKLVVKEALRKSGLKDDTTCLVVDILPSDHASNIITPPPSPKRNHNILTKFIFFGKWSQNNHEAAANKPPPEPVEVLLEEGSAYLDQRLPSRANCSEPFRCAICQAEETPSEDSETNKNSADETEGPVLCPDCRKKKDAMEGKNRAKKSSKHR